MNASLLKRGLYLEYLTLAWNVVGSGIIITAAYLAGSVALAGFGIDSLIEIFASVAAGFTAIDLEITRQYTVADIPASATGWAAGLEDASRAELVGRFASTFVRATKPAPGS